MGKREKITLCAIIFSYIFLFGALAALRHYNFQTQTWDLGIFTQIMWNITQGNGMASTLEFVQNHFAVHMSPILFLLATGYWFFPSPYYLLIIQTIVLALGALPIYLNVRNQMSNKIAPVIASAYLLYPSLHWINWFDFHPVAFFIPAMLAAFYFAEEKRWNWMSVFLALAASTQEDAILALAFFGIYLMLKKERKIGLLVFFFSMIYFLISIKLIMPYFGGGLLRLDRYSQLGRSFVEIIKNGFLHPSLFLQTIFMWPKFVYLFWLFLPVAFLPIFAPRALVLLVPGLAQNLLTMYPNQFSGTFQYDAVLIPGIFIAVIYGSKNANGLFAGLMRRAGMVSRLGGTSEVQSPRASRAGASEESKKIICVLAIATVFVFLLRSPISPFNFPRELFYQNEHWNAFRAIPKKVPGDASVAAHSQLVPHLANREHIYMLGLEPEMPDFVLIDGADYFGFPTPETFQSHIQQYADSGEYEAEIINDRYYVLKKNAI